MKNNITAKSKKHQNTLIPIRQLKKSIDESWLIVP